MTEFQKKIREVLEAPEELYPPKPEIEVEYVEEEPPKAFLDVFGKRA